MFKFISFGSGSCGNCYYLYTENDGLLIDVGVGTRSLKKSFGDRADLSATRFYQWKRLKNKIL